MFAAKSLQISEIYEVIIYMRVEVLFLIWITLFEINAIWIACETYIILSLSEMFRYRVL